MKANRTLVAAAIALASFASSAQVTTGLGSLGSTFLSLAGGTGANQVNGGAIYSQTQSPGPGVAIRPTNASSPVINTVGNWGAVAGTGNTNNGGGVTATLNFASGISAVSFLWGSPDVYNSIIVNTNGGSKTFTAAQLGLSPTGSGSEASYVNFKVAGTASAITSLTFVSSQAAFEFSNVAAVPEPGTYAMLLSGLMAVGFVVRRRRAQSGSDTPAGAALA